MIRLWFYNKEGRLVKRDLNTPESAAGFKLAFVIDNTEDIKWNGVEKFYDFGKHFYCSICNKSVTSTKNIFSRCCSETCYNKLFKSL